MCEPDGAPADAGVDADVVVDVMEPDVEGVCGGDADCMGKEACDEVWEGAGGGGGGPGSERGRCCVTSC